MRRGVKWTALDCSCPSMVSIATRASSRKKRCCMIVPDMMPVRHAIGSPHIDRVLHVVVTSTVSWSAFCEVCAVARESEVWVDDCVLSV